METRKFGVTAERVTQQNITTYLPLPETAPVVLKREVKKYDCVPSH